MIELADMIYKFLISKSVGVDLACNLAAKAHAVIHKGLQDKMEPTAIKAALMAAISTKFDELAPEYFRS